MGGKGRSCCGAWRGWVNEGTANWGPARPPPRAPTVRPGAGSAKQDRMMTSGRSLQGSSPWQCRHLPAGARESPGVPHAVCFWCRRGRESVCTGGRACARGRPPAQRPRQQEPRRLERAGDPRSRTPSIEQRALRTRPLAEELVHGRAGRVRKGERGGHDRCKAEHVPHRRLFGVSSHPGPLAITRARRVVRDGVVVMESVDRTENLVQIARALFSTEPRTSGDARNGWSPGARSEGGRMELVDEGDPCGPRRSSGKEVAAG
jgi:hypothetical protein